MLPLTLHQCQDVPDGNDHLDKLNLWFELYKYPFQDRMLVFKSAIYESGHRFESKNARKRHNLFGMRCTRRADGCQGGYATYDTWQRSVQDRYTHESLYYKGGSYREYINRHWGVMDGTYCDYLDKISIGNLTN
jgi:uncharacterized FlgJ-related protein